MADQNGSGPSRLEMIVDELSDELALQEAVVVASQAALAEAKLKRRKIQRALDELTGESTPKDKPKAKPTKGRTPPASEATQDQMRQVLATLTEPKTVAELAELAGLREDTARRAIKGLVDNGEVRPAGKRRQEHGYPASEFMPMPELMEATDAS